MSAKSVLIIWCSIRVFRSIHS